MFCLNCSVNPYKAGYNSNIKNLTKYLNKYDYKKHASYFIFTAQVKTLRYIMFEKSPIVIFPPIESVT